MSGSGVGQQVKQHSSKHQPIIDPLPASPVDEALMEVCESFERFRHVQSGSLGTSVLRVCYRSRDVEKKPKIKWDNIEMFRVILFEKSLLTDMEKLKDSVDLRTRFEIHFQPVQFKIGRGSRSLRSNKIYLTDVLDLLVSENNLEIIFCLGPDRGTYYLRFENRHDYSTFAQLLLAIFQKPEGSEPSRKESRGISEGATSIKMSQNLFQRASEEKFWEKKSNLWNYKDVINWTKHTLYQEIRSGTEYCEIISLHEKLIRLGQVKKFERFAREKMQDGWLLGQLQDLFPVPPYDSSHPPDRSAADDPKHDLYGIYCNKLVRDTVAYAIKELNDYDNMFDINFYRVLRKRVTFKSKPRADPSNPKKSKIFYPNLGMLRRILRFVKREWWSVEDCKNEILFLLLYNKAFSVFVKDKEEEFHEFCSMSENQSMDDMLPSIKKFDDRHKLQMENISFEVHIQHQASLIMKQISKLEEEKKRIREETKLLELNFAKRRASYESMMKKIESVDPKKAKLYEKLSVRLKEQVEVAQTKLALTMSGGPEGMQMKLIDLDRKIGRFARTINEFRQIDTDDLVRDHFFEIFLNSKGRKNEIQRLIRYKLEGIQQENEGSNTFVLTVKLVLGRLLMQPGKIHKIIARHLLKHVGGDYYKYGLTHASLTIKNMQLHWFNTGLIHFKDLGKYDRYKEFFCVDVDCPLICDFEKFNERIEAFAKKIIHFNTLYKYSPFNVQIGTLFGDNLKRNCQEFTSEMLISLGAADHYQDVENYLSGLKGQLEVADGFEDYQFFKVDPEFFERYRPAYEAVPEVGDLKQVRLGGPKAQPTSYTVIFRTHAQVDDFSRVLVRLNPNFPTEEAGKWVLLKAFDRSYHMREKKDRGDGTFASSEKGCPFSAKIKVKTERIVEGN